MAIVVVVHVTSPLVEAATKPAASLEDEWQDTAEQLLSSSQRVRRLDALTRYALTKSELDAGSFLAVSLPRPCQCQSNAGDLGLSSPPTFCGLGS